MIAAYGVEWHWSPYLIPALLAGLISTWLAAYAWQHREKRSARPFVALMTGLGFWAITYGIQLGFYGRDVMIALDRVSFVGTGIVPAAWLVLAIEYAGYEEWLSRRTLAALSVEPVVLLALAWTNGHHHLIYEQVGLDTSGPVTVLDFTFGSFYWLNLAYSYLLIAAGFVLLASVAVRANRILRRQSLVLIVGGAVPLGANLAFHFDPGLNPVENLDLTTFAFAVTGVAFALALFRYRLLDLVPVARERLVEKMDDGVVVLAADGSIVDLNPAARQLLSQAAVGVPVDETAIGDGDGVREGYVSMTVDGESRSFDVSATPISDFRGEEAGRFVVMRDITELQILRSHEQRLSVLNRLLRHNIRNELNVITGRSELLSEELDGDHEEHIDAIERATDRVLSISDQARHVETTIDDEADGEPVDAVAVAETTAGALRETYPAAEIRIDTPERALVQGIRDDHVRRILEALVENAIVHNDNQTPGVRISVEAEGRIVCLSVADDGPGIPDVEQAILDRELETPLEHGAGLGLWLVRWITESAGGEISFRDNDRGGTTVVVELPRAVERH